MNPSTHANSPAVDHLALSNPSPTGSACGPVATVVPDAQRLQFLPRHFGIDMMIAEATVYQSMRRICPDSVDS